MAKENTPLSQWNKKGFIEVNGKLVKSETQVVKNPDKIGALAQISIPKGMSDKQRQDLKLVDATKLYMPDKVYYPNSLIEVPERYLNPQPHITVNIKPLSVNDVWKGRRFKTDRYTQYALSVSLLLPNNLIIPEGLLRVYYEFGLSSNGGDWDNPVKPFQDILQEKYKFNDSRIMEAIVKKVIVKKGNEYIAFKIESYG